MLDKVPGKLGDKVQFEMDENMIGIIVDIRTPDTDNLSSNFMDEVCDVRLSSGQLVREVRPFEIKSYANKESE